MADKRAKSGQPARAMVFVRLDSLSGGSPCTVCITHSPSKKGYLWKKWRMGPGQKRQTEPFHRFIYRAQHGEHSIPDGWEIDHVCRNRACCEIRHLRALSRAEHLYLTNKTRNGERNEAARLEWEARGRCSPSELSETGLAPSTSAKRWIKEWLAEEAVQFAQNPAPSESLPA